MIEVHTEIDVEALAWELVLYARRWTGFRLGELLQARREAVYRKSGPMGPLMTAPEEEVRAALVVGLLKGWLFVDSRSVEDAIAPHLGVRYVHLVVVVDPVG